MKTLTVNLGARSYPIHIGAGLLNQAELLQQTISGNQVFIVSNSTVAPLYLKQVQASLAGYHCETCILPDGEEHKNLDSLNTLFTHLLEKKFSRKTTLIALGGGVIGDISGFAAACYQRGVQFVQIPTTLLAQVDSSVGGKTAVNHALGKNMIGAFHQPKCVIADINTLKTLPQREISAGLAEIIKYGLLKDTQFFSWLENHIQALLQLDEASLVQAIEHSCKIKAEIVALDEHENSIRALLNLGHTFGHAIETHTRYQEWLHGEAVAAGIVLAAELSKQLGYLNTLDLNRIRHIMHLAKLPTTPPQGLSPAHFVDLMGRDKKVIDSQLRLILLKQIGEAFIKDDIDTESLKNFLQQFCPAADNPV